MKTKIFTIISWLLFFSFAFSQPLFAKKIVVLFTGETHSALYPCHCPIEPFGGVARRATKIRELRKVYPDLLVVDSGNSFAGGRLDEYSVDEKLDKERTRINLSALKMMGYDSLAIGDAELNFGKEFLESQIKETGLQFISCNVKVKGAAAYLVKNVSGIKIGIVAVTPDNPDLSTFKISAPTVSLKLAIEGLKNKAKAELIILLSSLGEERDMQILQEAEGIDLLISGHPVAGKDQTTRIGNTIILRSAWQGRKLGKLEMEWEAGKVKDYAVELIGMGKDIPDDSAIQELLPRCFSDRDCSHAKLKGECQNPSSAEAVCKYTEYAKISLLVVEPKDCNVCNSQPPLHYLKSIFPGAQIRYLNPDNALAARLIKEFSVNVLPAYFIGGEAQKEKGFGDLQQFAILRGEYYYLSPAFAGVSYFMDRPRIAGQLDLFISLSNRITPKVIATAKSFLDRYGKGIKFRLHFVAGKDAKQGIISPAGPADIEESKRALCVNKYFPEKSWDYIFCRANNINRSGWEDCLEDETLSAKIKGCAQGEEADDLLKEGISLGGEIGLTYGPIFLLENQEVFGVTDQTSVEELKRFILKRR